MKIDNWHWNNIAEVDGWFYNFYKEHIRAINDFSEKNNKKKNFFKFFRYIIFDQKFVNKVQIIQKINEISVIDHS